LDTHSENGGKRWKEKVSNLLATALVFQANGSPLVDATLAIIAGGGAMKRDEVDAGCACPGTSVGFAAM
jgi:hypothetical protein